MKKLRIKDAESGEEFIVEELPEEDACHDEGETEQTQEVAALTAEEVAEIRALLPQLKELLAAKTTDEDTVEETVEETEEKTVGDSATKTEDASIADSAASKKQSKVVDTKVTDNSTYINEQWQKILDDALKGGDK